MNAWNAGKGWSVSRVAGCGVGYAVTLATVLALMGGVSCGAARGRQAATGAGAKTTAHASAETHAGGPVLDATRLMKPIDLNEGWRMRAGDDAA